MTAPKKSPKPKHATPEERRAARQASGRLHGPRGGHPVGTEALDVKRAKFVAAMATGMGPGDAAETSGYSRESVSGLLKTKPIRDALNQIIRDYLAQGRYSFEAAVDRTILLIDEAREASQFSAAAKLQEHLDRLCRITADRLEIDVAVDAGPNLLRAIERAEGRLKSLDAVDVEVIEHHPAPLATVPAPVKRHIFLD